MNENKFGKTSKLYLRAVHKGGQTILEDVHFTAPFKVMQPFVKSNGGSQVMFLSASAGIMAGDTQEFELEIGEDADFELLSQSYEKIHKMKEGCAKRKINALVGRNACLCYCPQPTIPFRDSAFQGQTKIQLADKTSHLFFSEILTCGRYARQEEFAYRFFHNFVEIYRGDSLLYRDNSRFTTSSCQMDGIGMYESYHHLACVFMTGVDSAEAFLAKVHERMEKKDLAGGITKLWDGDFGMRIFGKTAQQLEELTADIAECWHRFK